MNEIQTNQSNCLGSKIDSGVDKQQMPIKIFSSQLVLIFIRILLFNSNT